MGELKPTTVLHWNYRGYTEFPMGQIAGGESEITDIYLKDNLISSLPNEIGKLDSLESLYLSGNDITHLPADISRLKCLKWLDVSGNRLECLPDDIGDLRSLKFLILDDNRLTALPLRLAELKLLRFLSVCDNNLQWLAQRPVYNYFHCELRFWRNPDLQAIPYSLWYHMYRDQRIRCMNIGCLTIDNNRCVKTKHIGIKLRIGQSKNVYFKIPPHHKTTSTSQGKDLMPTLCELSKRKLYKTICAIAKVHSQTRDRQDFRDSYMDYKMYSTHNCNVYNLSANFQDFHIAKDHMIDINSTNERYPNNIVKEILKFTEESKDFLPSDILKRYFGYLPRVVMEELCNGPVSRCENAACKNPMFDYVLYEFCLGHFVLIDKIEQVLLSAVFCSKACVDVWRTNKQMIPWQKIFP